MSLSKEYFDREPDLKSKPTPWNKGPVYLAGCNQDQGREMRSWLHNIGVPVLASWLDASNFGQPKTDEQRSEIGTACFREIMKCDVLILLPSDERLNVGGMYVEAGFATGAGKRSVVYGRPGNTMLHSGFFWHAEDLHELYDVLGLINYAT